MIESQQYTKLFQVDRAGEAIFLELHELFYQQQSFTRGDSHETAFKEGQRAVIAFLMGKIAQGSLPPSEATEDWTGPT